MIHDDNNNLTSTISRPLSKGLNRVNWDLTSSISTAVKSSNNSYERNLRTKAKDGQYKISMYKRTGKELSQVGESITFNVTSIRKNTLENPLSEQHDDYYNSLAILTTKVITLNHNFEKGNKKLNTIKKSLKYLKNHQMDITSKVYTLLDSMYNLKREIGGSDAKAEIGEKDFQTLNGRLYNAKGGWRPNTYGPTRLHMQSFEIAETLFDRLKLKVEVYLKEIEDLQQKMHENGAPLILE